EVAGPGFINLFLDPAWLHDVLRAILALGSNFGRGEPSAQRVQVEFVSANPTGPLHVGTARNAALGDSLSNVMAAAGNQVQREYYFNDARRQMALYGASVAPRYLARLPRQAETPDRGYQGAQMTRLPGEPARET